LPGKTTEKEIAQKYKISFKLRYVFISGILNTFMLVFLLRTTSSVVKDVKHLNVIAI
jgi:hypothetical protein